MEEPPETQQQQVQRLIDLLRSRASEERLARLRPYTKSEYAHVAPFAHEGQLTRPPQSLYNRSISRRRCRLLTTRTGTCGVKLRWHSANGAMR